MKIKVEGEKIVKAVQRLDGIELVLESTEDAKEAINVILQKSGLFRRNDTWKLNDIKVTTFRNYETSAVDYKMMCVLEFVFDKGVPLDRKMTAIKKFQEFFEKL
jgi:hypothetical protein